MENLESVIMTEPKLDFQHLTVSERIQLTDAQRAELDRRLEACRKDPAQAIPWETLRRELLHGD